MDFSKWKEKEEHVDRVFIEDGILNKEYFDQADVKIMFLLKEAWGNVYEKSLVKKFSEENRQLADNVFVTAAKWVYGIRCYLENKYLPLYEELPKYDDEKMIKPFLSTAIVNIKKSGGESTSKNTDLKKWVLIDAKFLKDQIDQIAPDIIICGNTFEFYKVIYELEKNEVKKAKIVESEYLYKFEENGKNRVIIDYWHPSNRSAKKLLYYGLEPSCRGLYEEFKKLKAH